MKKRESKDDRNRYRAGKLPPDDAVGKDGDIYVQWFPTECDGKR